MRSLRAPPVGACIGIAIAIYGLVELIEILDAWSTSSGVPHGGVMISVALGAFAGFAILRIFRDREPATGVRARLASTLRTFLLVAAIALPIVSLPHVIFRDKSIAMIAGVKSDLRLIAARQDSSFESRGRYFASARQLGVGSTPELGPHVQLTRDGWYATQTFDDSLARCAIFVGSIPAYPAVVEHQLVCANLLPLADVFIAVVLLLAGLVLAVTLNRRAPLDPAASEPAAADAAEPSAG